MNGPYVAVVGGGEATAHESHLAEDVGKRLAVVGAVVVTGGLGGVMEAASRGAAEAGGLSVGILPGTTREEGNRWLGISLPTGLGEARNALVVRAADAVIAVGGGWGTLSEISLALKTGRPVVGLESWTPEREGAPGGVVLASGAAEAVERALELARG